MKGVELNLDGIVGPTHNYAGLARGNLASRNNAGQASNPKAAALEGLAKAKRVADLGAEQAVVPPQHRPELGFLRSLGFEGSETAILERASRESPDLLASASSASAMWMANAATVSPGPDTLDGRTHITPANLTSHLHRSLEPSVTAGALRKILPETVFTHHPPLPGAALLSDEGAANHLRLSSSHGDPGLEVFVYGRSREARPTTRYPARQTLEASQAVARRHQIRETAFLRQSPAAIDRGVFHNDVVTISDRNTLVVHESAFVDQHVELSRIASRYRHLDLRMITVSERELSLEKSVETYLFNSQLVSLPDETRCLVAPAECGHDPSAKDLIDRIIDDGGFDRVTYVDVRQSMQNGGGPACLRLRVPLRDEELAAVHPGVRLSDGLYDRLVAWVHTHYRDRLLPEDLADPQLLRESCDALDDLSRILDLGALYVFQ